MSEDQDESQKTEEPSEKRLREAREKGDVPRSQELNYFFSFVAVLLIVFFAIRWMVSGLGRVIKPFIESPDLLRMDNGGAGNALQTLILEVGTIMLVPMGVLIVFVIAGSLVQHGLLFSSEPLTPKLSKIGLTGGAKRMFGTEALVNFVKGMIKLIIVGAVFLAILWPQRSSVPQMALFEVQQILPLVTRWVLYLILAVTLIMSVIGIADFSYQKHKYTKKHRMTKQEVKDEFKQTEGDPTIKGRLRQLRLERSRQRMMAAVPFADVVVTNPTHFSVALKYDPASMGAPKVVAKGVDEVAMRIRVVARKNDVLLLENPPLARTLYASVDIDQEVPPEHYQAVAEVISYVMRAKGEFHKISQ